MKISRRTLLTIVMIFQGLLLIVSSALSAIPNLLIPLDVIAGTHASVAGMAFGAGLCLAAFHAERNISWVRAAIMYSVMVILFDVFLGIYLGGASFQILPFVIALIFSGLLIFLWPHRGELVPGKDPTTAPTAS